MNKSYIIHPSTTLESQFVLHLFEFQRTSTSSIE